LDFGLIFTFWSVFSDVHCWSLLLIFYRKIGGFTVLNVDYSEKEFPSFFGFPSQEEKE